MKNQRRQCDHNGRDWGDVAMSQRTPQGSSPAPPEGAQPCGHLDFGVLASGSVRECAAVLSHPVCGDWLRQAWGTNLAPPHPPVVAANPPDSNEESSKLKHPSFIL